MVREHDHLNQYYCPKTNEGDCVRPMCLRRRPHSDEQGMVGPAETYYECWDPETNAVMSPMVWNPVYNKGTNPPVQPQARPCTTTQTQECTWVWWIVAILAGILVILLVLWAINKNRSHSSDDHAAHAATSAVTSTTTTTTAPVATATSIPHPPVITAQTSTPSRLIITEPSLTAIRGLF
jgi:hypothetical protein